MNQDLNDPSNAKIVGMAIARMWLKGVGRMVIDDILAKCKTVPELTSVSFLSRHKLNPPRQRKELRIAA